MMQLLAEVKIINFGPENMHWKEATHLEFIQVFSNYYNTNNQDTQYEYLRGTAPGLQVKEDGQCK
jgi:hypothetical protein